jgi:hypothetical protein
MAQQILLFRTDEKNKGILEGWKPLRTTYVFVGSRYANPYLPD